MRIITAALAALAVSAAGSAQDAAGEAAAERRPLAVSAENFEVFEARGLAVYAGNVNAVRGESRLRADRIEVHFRPGEGGGFGEVTRLTAEGDVYYVTPEEVARGDRGEYDVQAEVIVLTGGVVLTRGCNVSTGDRLIARLQEGYTELQGSGEAVEGPDQRVRSVFFTDEIEGETASDCPLPPVPGGPPPSFEDELQPASGG